jgi:hypothetical protein
VAAEGAPWQAIASALAKSRLDRVVEVIDLMQERIDALDAAVEGLSLGEVA